MRQLGLLCLAGLLGARVVQGQDAPRRPWALGLEDVSPVSIPAAMRARVQDLEYADTDSIRGVVVDLNADGAPEYLLQSAPSLCGNGGCLYTLVDGKSGDALGQFFGNVLYVQRETDRGFPRLATYSHLSVASGTYATYAFDGRAYAARSIRTLEGGPLDSLVASLRRIPFWHTGR